MGYAVHDLRDLLSLAKMLRHFADEHAHDHYHELFLSTAVALEARAHYMANHVSMADLEAVTTLHAPVDLRV